MLTSDDLIRIDQSSILYFDFENVTGLTVTDKSLQGTLNNGYLCNATNIASTGDLFKQSAIFDGQDDYIQIKNSNDINGENQAKRTISLWFNADNKNVSDRKQIIYEEGGGGAGINIYIEAGKLYVGIWNTVIWQGTYLSTNTIQSGKWHHIALVLDAQTGNHQLQSNSFTAYLDGIKFGQGDAGELPVHLGGIGLGNVNRDTKTQDGKISGTANQGFKGNIDEVRIYNQALTVEDICYLAHVDYSSLYPETQLVYTVNESFNPMDSLTTMTTIEPITQHKALGINLSSIVDYSTAFPFIDAFKSARPWLTQTQEKWDTKESSKLNLDENGWVKSLTPTDGSTSQYTYVGTLLNWTNEAQSGKYVVLYDGVGTIEYSLGATKDHAASQLGRDVINTTGKIYLKITSTDPNQTGDYIRNIRVIPEAYESSYQTTVINPDYLAKIDNFHSVRFMDWMDTNDSTVKEWSDRNTLNDYTWHSSTIGGAPVEIMVKLANEGDFNPWFTIPHLATDDYVRQFAQYVKDNLEPGRKVYVEYSNEVWNQMFSQGTWIEEQGKTMYANSSESNYTKRIDCYSQRTVQIMQIWDEVFGHDKERVIGVMGAQAANIWTGTRALDYHWSNHETSHQETGIDAIAIAPYFGAYLGNPENAAIVEAWTKENDGGLNKLFDELTEGGLIKEKGALQESYQWITNYVQLAQKEGLELIAYEGGQHLVGHSGVENNTAITNLFIAANQDARMGQIYEDYLNQWYQLGGGLFNAFSDINSSSKWGSWGALESLHQESSPKYDALMNMIEKINAVGE